MQVGFAIPVDTVKSSVTEILQYGKVIRPVLGIAFAPDQSSTSLGVNGILVLSVREGGPADKVSHMTGACTYERHTPDLQHSCWRISCIFLLRVAEYILYTYLIYNIYTLCIHTTMYIFSALPVMTKGHPPTTMICK